MENPQLRDVLTATGSGTVLSDIHGGPNSAVADTAHGDIVAKWSTEQRKLWHRLSQLSLDAPDASFCFSRRLARENNWSPSFARRVVTEYRRFLFLCQSAGHACCPSDEVDQTWHLHLTYTRSYWDDLCRQTLQQPLHHEATRGGPAEHQKHVDMYHQTLASYRRFFQQEPPADIWPPAQQRFAASRHFRRVNTQNYWVIPHPWKAFRQLSSAVQRTVSGMFVAALLVPVAAGSLNPFDLPGPTFLAVYAALYVVTLTAALVIRTSLYQGRPGADTEELTPYEAACLIQNPVTAVGAAVCRLVHDGYLQESSHNTGSGNAAVIFTTTDKQPGTDADPLERVIYNTAAEATVGCSFKELHTAAIPTVATIEGRLQDMDLKPGIESHPLRLLPSAIMFMLLFFGLVKIGVGFSRHKNVGFLVLLSAVTFLTMLLVMLRPKMTAAGRRAVERWKDLARSDRSQVDNGHATGQQLAMAVGVYGLCMVSAPHLLGVQESWKSAGRILELSGNDSCGELV